MKRTNLVIFHEPENNAMDRTESMEFFLLRYKSFHESLRKSERSIKRLIESAELKEKYIENMVTKKPSIESLYMNRFIIDEDVEHELSSTIATFEKSLLTMTEMNERLTNKLKIYKGTISNDSRKFFYD